MVKKHKEKLYQSAREQRTHSQVRAGSAVSGHVGTVQRRLPFSHCALSLTAYENPVCNRQGIVFESTVITPFVLKHKMDPVSGDAMQTKDLIQLNMSKDEEGRWQCPVLTKPFSDHTKIMAVVQPGGTEANVYSWEAYHELNVKAGNYEDLISGIQFHKKKDVLVLYDPDDDALNARRDINQFYHVRHAREINNRQENPADNVRQSVTATRILDKLQKNKMEAAAQKRKADSLVAATDEDESSSATAAATAAYNQYTTYYDPNGQSLHILAHDVTGVEYTGGQGSSSLTSTAVPAAVDNQQRGATMEEIRTRQFQTMRQLKKKGYVRLRTNQGDVTLELHCDIVPRTCANFLGLCAAGKYNGSLFHRLIPKFMIQGGKPVNSEEEEECLWGGTMVDEFDDRLHHSGNIISMANAGSNTNKRQFFLSFRSAPHLDRKHSVFGTVVEGQDRLMKWETIPTDKKECPKEEVKILGTDVLVDPYQEARDMEQKRLQKIIAKRTMSMSTPSSNLSTAKQPRPSSLQDKSLVGRYLKKDATQKKDVATGDGDDSAVPMRLPPPPKKTNFGNFSGW